MKALGPLLAACILLSGSPERSAAQQIPPDAPPDTIVPDIARPDTIVVIEDEIEVRNLPDAPRPVPAGWSTGVWEWDREALLSTRAVTLLELLEEVVGVVPLRGGDFGQPAAATAFGLGAGRVRIFLDGAELAPLGGGVVDLSRVGLAGFDRVRVERRPGELRIELRPLRFQDVLPYTLLEVGTGDLNTNLFRGTFGHPTALGGNVSLALDRIDTEGPFRDEPGASFGAHVRHTLFLGERSGVAWELRRMNSRRPAGIWGLRDVSRTDLGLHGRYEAAPGILASAFLHRSSLGIDPPGEDESALGPGEGPRSQAGVRLSAERGSWWAEADLRRQWGAGWPSWAQGFRAGGYVAGLGGASASLERQGWAGEGAATFHARTWTDPLVGFVLFAEVEDGRRAVPHGPGTVEEPDPELGEPDPAAPPFIDLPAFTDRSGLRGGAEFQHRGIRLGAAALRVQADSLHPLGFLPDREGVVTAGPSRSGFEASAVLPLTPILEGLGLEGGLQLWDQEAGWRYLPRRLYQARVRYHDIFFATGNLEVWADVGVRGRDPMWLPLPLADAPGSLALVPSQQSWFGRLQIRVVSVRIFVLWDNFTVRQRNQDFPDRILPPTRAMYGVRWTLWN